MIGDGAGLLVPQGDVGALAAAMDDLIRDAARREEYGRAAKKRAENFAAGVVIPRFEQAYREVLAAGVP
jgi:glycosyltransferase involved in cell wall biosynthesis